MNGLTKHTNGHDRVRSKLRAFLEQLSPDEIATLRERERRQSSTLLEVKTPQPNRKASNKSIRLERQYLSGEDPVIVDAQDPLTPTLSTAPPPALAGSLPGVYHNYLLVRPDPSLHILFASSALQTTADLRQTPLLSHISTSVNTLAGLQKAFVQGIPVTGRVVWKPTARAAGAMQAPERRRKISASHLVKILDTRQFCFISSWSIDAFQVRERWYNLGLGKFVQEQERKHRRS